ncbi:MAG TPA: esterase-like activity of phytase family protein [Sphingomonas sp.]|uniref:esterase-like activity of phytase family protein n=1 Tax=Sphingomonas sp. TaxID=28214 RepID=UPI002B8D4ABA|nr:esterase-like activity of phytase family protein [Sphingomonas sp.]HMI18967.1 esterase-like activity of phytase family protein [Sphingomonas sp.]
MSPSRPLRAALALLALFLAFPAFAGGEAPITRPHLDQTKGAQSVTLHGRTYIDQGLVGTGKLPAGTVDFLGDTLGSFSSLQIAPGSWKRVGGHYEGILWTLPDRGRNDPAANLFFDYAARLERLRIRFAPKHGRVTLTPDGGLALRDYNGRPFTGADPGAGTLIERGITLPAPANGVGAGKVSIDAESLQFTRDGGFYVGDEYAANVYYFDKKGRLRGVIQPPAAIAPRRDGRPFFGSLQAPDSGRRNNQGVEGMSLSPDGRTLFVALQSALIQDSATGDAAGRTDIRVLVYDVRRTPTPARPIAHYVVQLPAYNDDGDGGAPNRTAAQSEIRALDGHRFLMLARDSAGLGAGKAPIVYKSILLVDLAGATNLAGTAYEIGPLSVLRDPAGTALRPDIVPADRVELVNMLNPVQLARFGLGIDALSEKWEAMDLVSVRDPRHPADYFLLVGNDNDFIARRCLMSGQPCDSDFDNDNRILVYRVRLPAPLR